MHAYIGSNAVMIVISVSGLKGGSGKTLIATNVAAAGHQAGHRTLLVDLDAQATASTWAARAAELGHAGPAVVAMGGTTLRRDLERVGAGFDLVVLDTPPRLGPESRAAMLVADVIVLPVSVGVADSWALNSTLTLLEEAKAMRPELEAGLVLNRWDKTSLATAGRNALEAVDVPILGQLGARVAFAEAMAQGRGVVDSAPKSEAALELRRLVKAISTALGAKEAA